MSVSKYTVEVWKEGDKSYLMYDGKRIASCNRKNYKEVHGSLGSWVAKREKILMKRVWKIDALIEDLRSERFSITERIFE